MKAENELEPPDAMVVRATTAPPATKHLDLDHLLPRIASRDLDAFEVLYDALASTVYGISLRVIQNPSLAEEASQDTFIQVWQNAERFDAARGRVKTWVATIAHRRAVDIVRHSQRSADRDALVVWSSGPDFDTVAETVEANDERHRVRACLTSLTALQRESIELAYYGALTHREVAARLGVKPSTVSSRMRDGLLRLRPCMSAETTS